MSSVFGWNEEGGCEVCCTKSYQGKWFVSIRWREPLRRWWHSPSIYTRNEAQTVASFLFSLSDELLEKVIEEKLEKVLV